MNGKEGETNILCYENVMPISFLLLPTDDAWAKAAACGEVMTKSIIRSSLSLLCSVPHSPHSPWRCKGVVLTVGGVGVGRAAPWVGGGTERSASRCLTHRLNVRSTPSWRRLKGEVPRPWSVHRASRGVQGGSSPHIYTTHQPQTALRPPECPGHLVSGPKSSFTSRVSGLAGPWAAAGLV